MKSSDIRESFLHYFERNGHTRVKSSSLIPAADPTLLFTNSGMVQFKDCFLGIQDNGYRRATTAQKSLRAGGKHNDLENVGFTPRHHTFFEMLGNFSFGDYFKEEAIVFAWTLLTKEWALPKDKLWVTVFKEDSEAEALWKKIGVPPERIERLGEKDNFWAMGDTGPCGPCTEIHYDWGTAYGNGKSPGTDTQGRYLEIWNLVFMQFNRDSQGKMTHLPKPSVDTGSGLERVSSVMQGKFSNYDCDLFAPLISAISEKVKQPYKEAISDPVSASMRVIADHLRSGTFLLADGVTPSNEGRGYVLRRILRRAIRHGKKLGQETPFLHSLVQEVVTSLGKVYPELHAGQKQIETFFREEEEKFHETLHRGMHVLENAFAEAKRASSKTLPGDIAFKLYDTFGFPLDLTSTIAAEHALAVDENAFETLMAKQRASSTFKGSEVGAAAEAINKVLSLKRTETGFAGYETTRLESALELLFDESGTECTSLSKGQKGFAVFPHTVFYAESGGQVGDCGEITSPKGQARVFDTKKNGRTFLHSIEVKEGIIQQGATYQLSVDESARRKTAVNHTATHLLHSALRNVLGDRVKQAGSLVDPNRLRFDFSYPKAVTAEELERVESFVNEQIRKALPVHSQEMAYDEAVTSGALAFFDEKYGDRVRVVRIGDTSAVSVELCGGTHLTGSHSGEIGFFKILSESSVASGVRRVEAITSESALRFLLQRHNSLRQLEQSLGTTDVAAKVSQLQESVQSLQKANEKLQIRLAQGSSGGSGSGNALWEKAVTVGALRLVIEQVAGVNPKILRTLVDQVRDKVKTGTVVVLAAENEGKVSVCLGLTSDLVSKYNASQLIQPLAKELGGTGGGKPDFAQAGGTQPEKIGVAFENFKSWLATL
jgi:alanyl-tRNA synthetase